LNSQVSNLKTTS